MRAWPAAVAAVVVVCSGVAWAAFTDQKTSPQTLQAADTWPMMLHMISGSYTGNGAKGRAIKATSWRPDLVIIRGETGQVAVARTSTMTGDQTKLLVGGAALDTNNITSLDSAGFTVGSDNRVNAAGVVYHWIALQAGPGTLTVGSYAGDGTASRSITGVGFSPEYVFVLDSGNARPVQRYAGMSRAYQFDGDTGQATTRISSLDAGGFTVGNSAEVNKAGDLYHWAAFNISPGSVDIGSYAGDGADNRAITGIGFQPGYLQVKADNSATNRAGVHRFSSQSGDNTFLFTNANGSLANLVQALQDDGFQVGTDATVNQSTIKNFYLALRNTASSCQQEGTYSITSPKDTWLDQANPTSVKGATDQNLRVRSKAGQNRRALVRHTLPDLDPDCVVKSAKLVLTATGAKPGRTLNALAIAAAWTDTTASWNNQPATTGAAAPAPSASANGAAVEFDVTAAVQAMYAGTATNNGFLVKDAAEDDGGGVEQVFGSNENTVADPQMILVVGAA
jgi:predicted ribosomally synthesized peptide with SipW-like signal peptide